MNQELLLYWFSEAEEQYTVAVDRDDIQFPRDAYIALHVQERIRCWEQEKTRQRDITLREQIAYFHKMISD